MNRLHEYLNPAFNYVSIQHLGMPLDRGMAQI